MTRLFKLLLIACLVLMFSSNTLALNKNPADFADMEGHWAEQDFLELNAKGILSFYKPPLLQPQEYITRGEAALLLAKSIGLSGDEEQAEISEELPDNAKDYILVLMKMEIFKGYPSGLFLPNKFITREEMACVLSRVLAKDSVRLSNTVFKDKSKIDNWAESNLERALQTSVVRGYPDKNIRPNKYVSRAEAIVMINRMLNLNVSHDEN